MLFSNPHQFGMSIDIRMTPIRVVCNNTLTLSLSQKSDKMVTLSHRKEFNPEMVKEQLGIAREKLENYIYRQLSNLLIVFQILESSYRDHEDILKVALQMHQSFVHQHLVDSVHLLLCFLLLSFTAKVSWLLFYQSYTLNNFEKIN